MERSWLNKVRRRVARATIVAIGAISALPAAAATVEYKLVKISPPEEIRGTIEEEVDLRLRESLGPDGDLGTVSPLARESMRKLVTNVSQGYTMTGVLRVCYGNKGSVVSATIANLNNLSASSLKTEVYNGSETLEFGRRFRDPRILAADSRSMFCLLADMVLLGDYLPKSATKVRTWEKSGVTTTRYVWKRGKGQPYYTDVDRSSRDGRLLSAWTYEQGPRVRGPRWAHTVSSWTSDGKPAKVQIIAGSGKRQIKYIATRLRESKPLSTDFADYLQEGEQVFDVRLGSERGRQFEWYGEVPPIEEAESPFLFLSLIAATLGTALYAGATLGMRRFRSRA